MDEVVGKPIAMLMPERMRLRHERGFTRYQESVEPHIFGSPVQMTALRADGTEIDIDVTLAEVHVPRTAEDQTAPGVLVVATLRDVAARVAMQRRLSVANIYLLIFRNR